MTSKSRASFHGFCEQRKALMFLTSTVKNIIFPAADQAVKNMRVAAPLIKPTCACLNPLEAPRFRHLITLSPSHFPIMTFTQRIAAEFNAFSLLRVM